MTVATQTCTTTRPTYGLTGVPTVAWAPCSHVLLASVSVLPPLLLQVLMFQEEYEQAVASFLKASAIDPSLPAQEQVDGITRHVKRVANLVKRKVRCSCWAMAAVPFDWVGVGSPC